MITGLSNAGAFEYEGVKYEDRGGAWTKSGYRQSNSAYITPGHTGMSGNLIIPETVSDGEHNYNVTGIGRYSFFSYDLASNYGKFYNSINTLVIPNTVTIISDGAFTGNGLTTVLIGKNVNDIGYQAFNYTNCKDFYILCTEPPTYDSSDYDNFIKGARVHVPYGYKETYENNNQWKRKTNITDDADIIEKDGIRYKYDPVASLTSTRETYAIVVGTTDKSIKKAVIPRTVTGLFDAEIPVNEIADNAFAGCKNLTEVSISDDIVRIGKGAFSDCTSLAKVTVGNAVVEIKDRAFYNCTALKMIGLPESVKRIGDEAFSGCSSLEYVLLSKGLNSIGYQAFSGCIALSEVEIEDLTRWCGVTLKSCRSNPMFYSHGFSMKGKKQTSLEIPEGVEQLKGYNFIKCSSIEDVSFPESLKEIGPAVFAYSGVKRIDATGNLTELGDSAFMQCDALESVTFSEKMQKIGKDAFFSCGRLSDVSFQNSGMAIGKTAFASCASLAAVNVGNGLGIVESDAFRGCKTLKNVSTTSLSGWCAQTFMTKESNPLSQGASLILNGEIVTALNFGDDVGTVKKYAFVNCGSLTSVNTGTKVSAVGSEAFAGCANLSTISFEDKVQSIGSEVCRDCPNLAEVYFGKNVYSIGDGMFAGCINLHLVSAFMSRAPRQDSPCFEDISCNNATLYVCPGAYSTYRITAPWSNFRKIYEYEINIDSKELGLINDRIFMNEGDVITVNATTTPASLQDQLVWTSSYPKKVSVDNGVIKALDIGKTIITVSAGRISKSFEVMVFWRIKSVILNVHELRMEVDEQTQLKVKFQPDIDEIDRTLEWTSSDTDVVEVYDGFVTAKAPGSAVITVKTVNGLTDQCKIDVIIPASGIAFDLFGSGVDGDEVYMEVGDYRELKVVVFPENSTDRLTWSSSNENIVSVTDGLLEALSSGQAYVTVSTESGQSAEVKVNVGSSPIEDIFADETLEIDIYNVQGLLILKDAKISDLEKLNRGIYIARSASEVRKIIID